MLNFFWQNGQIAENGMSTVLALISRLNDSACSDEKVVQRDFSLLRKQLSKQRKIVTMASESQRDPTSGFFLSACTCTETTGLSQHVAQSSVVGSFGKALVQQLL